MDRSEMINLVRMIMNCEGTEEEIDEWLMKLKESVSYPDVSDLIFYPEGDTVTPESIVDKILSYNPVRLS